MDSFSLWTTPDSSWTQFKSCCSTIGFGDLLGRSIFISWQNAIWHVSFWHKNSQWLPAAKRTKSKDFGMASRSLRNLIIVSIAYFVSLHGKVACKRTPVPWPHTMMFTPPSPFIAPCYANKVSLPTWHGSSCRKNNLGFISYIPAQMSHLCKPYSDSQSRLLASSFMYMSLVQHLSHNRRSKISSESQPMFLFYLDAFSI